MTTAPRNPLSKWRYPTEDTLLEKDYAIGKPPFDPFPSVTNVLNAAFCPQAAWHDFINGSDRALLGQYDGKNLGELFHGFVAHLKHRLRDGTIVVAGRTPSAFVQVVNTAFLQYSAEHGYPTSSAAELWSQGIGPWVRRKVDKGELGNLSKNDCIFFEVSISNPAVEFRLANGTRHYPLYGRADEIDVTGHKIIERTIKPPLDGKPPLLKDLEVWLYWKALTTLPRARLPLAWKSVDFTSFELLVETPHEDFIVTKDSHEFVEMVHSAYAWIHDICSFEASGLQSEVIDNARCDAANPDPQCAHPFRGCFPRKFTYPIARPEMRRTFKPWYRMLLWERLWQDDLWWYQTLQLPTEALVEKGLISTGKIVSTKPDRIEIALEQGQPRIAGGYDEFELVTFGTMYCGLRTKATLLEVQDGKLVMKVMGEVVSTTGHTLILPASDDSSSIFQRQPSFLIGQSQRGLFTVQRMGLFKAERAAVVSQVQLLESIFGPKGIRGRKT